MDVLLLNVNGAPARVIDERRALSLLARGKAVLVLEQPRPLRSAHGTWPRPSVLYLTRFARMAPVAWSRWEVSVRDGHRCVYCGALGMLTLDHVYPQHRCRAEGLPPNTWENTVAACLACQRRKGGQTLEQSGLRFRPGYRPAAPGGVRPSLRRQLRREAAWQPFLPAGW
jgi:5-methylcytosine-specific restriction endonuclease McrA